MSWALLLALACQTPPAAADDGGARAILLELSPLPAPPADPTNAVYENPAAAQLGQALFYDARLSADGTVSCASCHQPARSWSDGKTLGVGLAVVARHTMTLWNVAYNRWFFWDGRKDTLWSQALGPLEDPREHGTSRLAVVRVLAEDARYARAYAALFGALPALEFARLPRDARPVAGEPEHPQQLAWDALEPETQEALTRAFVNVGKAIAAFERRLVSLDAPFDRYVSALRANDAAGIAAYDARARRGAALFVGKARCVFCHDGPNFTDLEFHDNRAPLGEGGDPGRRLGIKRLRLDPLNSRSAYADDGGETGKRKITQLLVDNHAGKSFKTPTLRNVARTAPYMHDGQFATLAEVVRFYDTLENASPELGNERLIQPLGLSEDERADLVAFLESLTDERLPAELLAPPASPELAR